MTGGFFHSVVLVLFTTCQGSWISLSTSRPAPCTRASARTSTLSVSVTGPFPSVFYSLIYCLLFQLCKINCHQEFEQTWASSTGGTLEPGPVIASVPVWISYRPTASNHFHQLCIETTFLLPNKTVATTLAVFPSCVAQSSRCVSYYAIIFFNGKCMSLSLAQSLSLSYCTYRMDIQGSNTKAPITYSICSSQFKVPADPNYITPSVRLMSYLVT